LATPVRVRRSHLIKIKRVYEKPAADDGVRILVDRLWPRGFSKAALSFDVWLREVAPSATLRSWYGHDPQRYSEFRRRYCDELSEHADELAALRKTCKRRAATLLTATRDLELSHAKILREVLGAKK
jgi:uncharacterized protein YeaO (DUF488 family)